MSTRRYSYSKKEDKDKKENGGPHEHISKKESPLKSTENARKRGTGDRAYMFTTYYRPMN